ncbi:MAG: SH3 domain-containing protein [Acidimicrobiia bacterium]|nr:SH3 domain-containing protein [Acidimicrobiia bacterium]
MSRRASGIAVLALAIAGCGGGDVADTTTTPPTLPETTATTVEPTRTTTIPDTTTSLPGDPIDIGPQPGDVLAVVGVAHDDVLNVRFAPGTDQTVIEKLDPLASDVVALGNARALPASIWFEVETDDGTGWASSSFLAYLGGTTDATADIVELLGEVPVAETMLDLGLVVAQALASDEPPSRIVMSVAPTVGDLGEVTYDVVGIGDDAVRGFRLHVFATPDEGGEGFVLKSVEQTVLCGRGLSGELCV